MKEKVLLSCIGLLFGMVFLPSFMLFVHYFGDFYGFHPSMEAVKNTFIAMWVATPIVVLLIQIIAHFFIYKKK